MSTKEIGPGRSPSAVCRWALCGVLVWGGLMPSSMLIAGPATADSGPTEVWWQQSEVVASLNLSSDQVASLETELMTHRQEIDELSDRFGREQDQLEQMMEDPEAGSSALQDQMRRAIESRGALEVAHGGFLLAIREVLDPSQWQALKAYAARTPLSLDPTRPLPPRPPEPPSPVIAPTPSAMPSPSAPAVVPDPPEPMTPPRAPSAPSVPEPAAPRAAPAPEAPPAAVSPPEPRSEPAPPAIPEPAPAPAIEPVVAPSLPPAAPLPPAPPAPEVWWHDRSSQKHLGLSRRQIDQLDEVANRHATRLEAIQESIHRVERELGPIIDADELESGVARGKLAELGRARMDLRLALRDMDLELRQLLSSDQRSILSGSSR